MHCLSDRLGCGLSRTVLLLVLLLVLSPVVAQEARTGSSSTSGGNSSSDGGDSRPPAMTRPTTTSEAQNESGAGVVPTNGEPANAPPKGVRGSQGTWRDVRSIEGLERSYKDQIQTKLSSLPRFGEEFFKRSREELVKSQTGAVPEDYAISTGDELQVTTYNTNGGQPTIQSVPVMNTGDAYLEGLGAVDLSGMTRTQAESTIDQRYRQTFPSMRTRVTFAKIPQINVNILGEAAAPGSYQMNPGSTVLDALLWARGPSLSGSYRKVQLHRGGTVIATYDIYNVLVHGKTAATRLRNGDRLFIPLMGPEVAILGEVKRPGRFELSNETTLADVLRLAGDVSAEGYSPVLKVNRSADNLSREVIDVPLADAKKFLVRNGDVISVSAVTDDLANGVYLSGAVKRPGWYQYKRGMRVTDLIQRAEGLQNGAYAEHAEIYREGGPADPLKLLGFELGLAFRGDQNHNIVLWPRDRVVVHEAGSAVFDKDRVRVQGEVSKPGEYPRFSEMRVRDLLVQAGGLTPEAAVKAEITRTAPDGSLIFIPINVEQVMGSVASLDNISVQPLDVLIVRKELRARRWPASITLTGEFNNPGVYTIDPERETLQSVIDRAGGLTPQAYPLAAVLTRSKPEILRQDREQLAKEVFENIQSVARIIASVENRRRSAAAGSEATAVVGVTEGELPRVLDKILATERVPLNLTQVVMQGTGDPRVKDGDVLYIPQRPEMVVVSGAVLMPSSVIWQPDKSVKAYIERTGGFTDDAAEDKIVVMRVNGELVREDKARSIQPGDLIIVPPKAIIAKPGLFENFLNLVQAVSGGIFRFSAFR